MTLLAFKPSRLSGFESDKNIESAMDSGAIDLVDEAPDGGVRACIRLLNTFGIFQIYYQKSMLHGESSSVISWIGSVQLFLLFIGGLVFGPLFDRYGPTVLMVPGTILYVLSLMLTSLCTSYYQLILAQGVLFGVSDAMLFYPTISLVSHWFDQKRGLALGVVVAGSSLGGIAWPLILPRLFEEIGFPWATRITASICLALLAPSCYLLVPRLPPRKASVQVRDFGSILKDTGYLIFVAGMFFILWGMFIPFYYLPIYGLAHNMSSDMSNNLIVTLNAGSLVGRVASGIIADRLGRFNVTFVSAFLAGIVILCLHAIKTAAGIIVFSVLYGFFSGGLISLQSACVAQITYKKEAMGIRIGVMMAVCSFGALTGNPIGGALISSEGGRFGGFITFSGLILLIGAFLALCARFVLERSLLKAF